MGDSLNHLNYTGLLSALEQNLSSMPDVSESYVAELNGQTTFNHREKKFLYRAAKYAFDQRLSSVQTATSTSGTITAGAANVNVVLNFDNAVTVTGAPRVLLSINGNNRVAAYFAGTGTTQLSFGYATAATDVDTGIASVNSNVDLNSGTLVDAYGKNVGLSFTDPATLATLVIS